MKGFTSSVVRSPSRPISVRSKSALAQGEPRFLGLRPVLHQLADDEGVALATRVPGIHEAADLAAQMALAVRGASFVEFAVRRLRASA